MNETIETACLSSAILSKSAMLKLVDAIEIDDFYFDANRIIFTTLLTLHNDNIDIDITVIKNELDKQKKLEDIGGLQKLVQLFRGVASSANIEYYIEQLLEQSKKRKLTNSLIKFVEVAKDKSTKPDDIINDLEQKIKHIDKERGKNIFPVDEIFGEDISKLQLKNNNYVQTGYQKLDARMHGFFNGELVIIAARPGMGKTSLALNIARNIADNKRVLFFSYEMKANDLCLRLVASECMIDFNRIRLSNLDLIQLNEIKQAYPILKKLDLQISDNANYKVENIVNATKRLNEYKKVDIIFVDYIGLIKATDRRLQRVEQVKHITGTLKQFAMSKNIPVVVLCQLNRLVESRADPVPVLSDLRESGDIEQDSDKVIFIYEDKKTNETFLIVAKNRNGPTDRVGITFEKQFTKFI